MADSTTARLASVVALVTGGSRGIGAGCVRCLHAAGASVVFCSNAPDEGRALEAELGGDRALFVEADCRVEADVERVVAAAVQRFGGLDCLVNNVGGHPPTGSIDTVSVADFRRLFDLNVVSGFLFSQKALPHLRRSRRSPSIVNVGSMVNVLGQAGAVGYVATKGAVGAMTRALAIDEAAHGVRVNTISPSNIDTPMMRENVREDTGPDAAAVDARLAAISNWQLSGRMGTSRDVGNACVFLASSDADFITGIDLYLSGGSELNYGEKVVKKAE